MAVFEVPESKAKSKDGQVQFRLPGSRKVFTFPKLQYLPTEAAAAAAAFQSGEFGIDTLKGLLSTMFGSDEAAELAVKMDSEQLSWLMENWAEASDTSVGESQPSDS